LSLKNKNITLRIVGGLGNQLFIFAFLLYLEKHLKTRICIDFKSGYQNILGSNKHNEIFLLYKLKYNFYYQKDKFCYLGYIGKLRRFLLRKSKLFSIFTNTSYVTEDKKGNILTKIRNNKFKNIYIDGYFQDLKYINENKKKINNLIKTSISFNNNSRKINANNTMCILYSNYMHQTNKSAINFEYKLKKVLKNFNLFYIFSYNYSKNLNKIFKKKKIKNIKPNKKKDSFKNLILISKFKYFISDNSTYHWWGIWLSNFKKKTVYKLNKINKNILYNNYVN